MNDSYRLRRQIYVILIVGAVAAVAGRIANLQQARLRNIELWPTHSSNDRSRWATVRSLGDHGTYVIGRRATDASTGKYEDTGIVFEDNWKTVDKVLDPEPAPDGPHVHYFYSSKPPLFPTMVAGEYWLLKQVGLSMADDLSWIVRIILLTFNVLPFAIYLYLLGRLADRYGTSDWGRLLLVFAAGFATFVTTFSNTLNNHTVATFLALFGLASFLRIWATPAAEPPAPPAPAEPPPAPATTEKPVSGEPASPPAVAEKPVAAADESPQSASPDTAIAASSEAEKAEVEEKKAEAEEDEKSEARTASEEVFSSFRMTQPAAETAETGPASSSALPPVRAAGAGSYFLAGLFTALAAALDLPALAFTALAFLLLFMQAPGRTLKFFLPPVLLVLGLFLLTNYLAIGRLLPAYAEVGAAASPWYQYEGSHWRQDPAKPKTGIDFADEDKVTYALHFLIGHHGVFALSPLFLLSLMGMAMILWRGRQAYDGSLVALAGMTFVLTVVVIGFYIWKTNNYAGNSSGPRWLMWLTPFWLLTMLPALDKMSGCRWGRGITLTLLAVSVLSASYPVWNPWQQPWIYQYVESLAPWMKY